MENILNFDDFSLNEKKRNLKKSNLSELEYVVGGVKYKNELFPGVNVPKHYQGKGKYKYRVLAKEGERVKPISFGDRSKKSMYVSKLSKKYWDSIPYYR